MPIIYVARFRVNKEMYTLSPACTRMYADARAFPISPYPPISPNPPTAVPRHIPPPLRVCSPAWWPVTLPIPPSINPSPSPFPSQPLFPPSSLSHYKKKFDREERLGRGLGGLIAGIMVRGLEVGSDLCGPLPVGEYERVQLAGNMYEYADTVIGGIRWYS